MSYFIRYSEFSFLSNDPKYFQKQQEEIEELFNIDEINFYQENKDFATITSSQNSSSSHETLLKMIELEFPSQRNSIDQSYSTSFNVTDNQQGNYYNFYHYKKI